jgi:IS5 family transposase
MEGQHGPVVEVAPHKGYAQDSTIIDADPGAPTEEELKRLKEIEHEKDRRRKEEQQQRRAGPEQPQDGTLPPAIVMTTTKPKPRGDKAKTTRSRDGTWTKKHGKSFFGYKLHTKDELASGFIIEMEVTTASSNDGTVDLSKKREVCVRDRGYPQGGRGHCISMIRATRGQPLAEKDRELNRFLAKVRAPVEHPFATIKRVFHCGRVLVTTVRRVKVRLTFVCTCYNLFRALELASTKGR